MTTWKDVKEERKNNLISKRTLLILILLFLLNKNTMAVQGLWNIAGYNLPDFGISEFLGIGPKNTAVVAPQASKSMTGGTPKEIVSKAGGSTSQTQYGLAYNPPSSNNNTNSNNGVYNGGSSNNGSEGSNNQSVNTPSIEDQINAIYSPIASYLDSAKSSVDTEYGNYKNELNQQYDTSSAKLATQKDTGLTELASDQTSADKRKTDALTAATNLYNELMRGGKQRFGGATSAGQAFTELSNTELQKSSNNVQTLWEEASQKITQYKADLETQYESSLKDLELARTSALNQAYSDYQSKIQEINMYKAQNESSKASAKLDALNNLRNQVYNLNLNTLNLATTLASNKDVALNYVDQYSKKVANNLLSGQNVYTSLTENTTTNPTSYLSSIGSSGKTNNTLAQTGSISSGKKTYKDI